MENYKTKIYTILRILIKYTFKNGKTKYSTSKNVYTNPGFCPPSLKSAWDLVYSGQNYDVREILRNLIGSLEPTQLFGCLAI